MKLRSIFLAAVIAMTPLAGYAASQLSDFPLADRIKAKIESGIERQPAEKPLFAFLHLYEPHTPYEPPEPYASRYRGREYDGEIAFADELVGRFFDFLKKRGLYDRALVFVLSDHGEGLGEHGEDEHGLFLYRYALQVPLMVKLPGSGNAGASVATAVPLIDVFTTVIQAAGVAGVAPPPGTDSLLDVAAGRAGEGRRIFAETLFPRLHFGWADTASLVDGPWHYIESPKPELYDLKKDPREIENLAEGKPPSFRTLRIEMEKRRSAFTAPGPIDPEEAKKLASLGYLSSGVPAGSGPLPDAKDEVFVIRDLKTGSDLLRAGRYPEAIVLFRKLLDRNPRMLEVWDLYAEALQKMHRNEEALAALKQAIASSPDGATNYFVAVAKFCLRLGRLEEAEKNAEIARGRGDPAADDVLIRIHLMKKEWPVAEAEAKAMLAAQPNKRLPYLALARVEVERNNLPTALQLVERARNLGGGRESMAIFSLHFLRGDILARMGRPAEAEPEFLEEIRLFPDNLDAYASLVALSASQGRLEEARDVVRRLVTANPMPESFALGMKALAVVGDRAGAESVRRAGAARFPSDRRFSAKT